MKANSGDSKGGPTAETLARASQVARWLVDGHGTAGIYDLARDAWAISSRQTDRLVAMARQELTAAWEVERRDLVALYLARADAVYTLAMSQHNSGAAVAALGFAAKLARL